MKTAEEAKKAIDAKKLKHDPSNILEKPPEGFDSRALHVAGEYEDSEDDSDTDTENDDFLDDDEEEDFWNIRRAMMLDLAF